MDKKEREKANQLFKEIAGSKMLHPKVLLLLEICLDLEHPTFNVEDPSLPNWGPKSRGGQ